jgi:cell filamentation protein
VIDKYGVGRDSYCYSGTHTLKNLLGIKEEALLESAEREITEIEAQRLPASISGWKWTHSENIV